MIDPLKEFNYHKPPMLADIWTTIDGQRFKVYEGQRLKVYEMGTSHLINCLKMVQRGGRLANYDSPMYFPRDYRSRVLEGMVLELNRRGSILSNTCYYSLTVI